MAASATASRCTSRFKIGRQNACGRSPPTNSEFLFHRMCWGVIDAATFLGAAATNAAACLVVICSMTTRRPGSASSSGVRILSMNTASRSKKSIAGSVTSPCTSSGMSTSSMALSVCTHFFQSVTPLSLFVVAPAGYILNATTPRAFASSTSPGVVLSVRYIVISGVNDPLNDSGTAASIRSLYAMAMAGVVTGGTRLGMMMDR
mmetsp:Transcript_1005/g.3061  ORF Transcript_1005/g.3061 Transcript_1005/m.3061 type:complete len:204 (-) Transcript_1005:366-977(-)